MYFLLHTLRKKALPDLSLFFVCLLYFPQRAIEPPKVGSYYNNESEEGKKWTYRRRKESSLSLRLLRRMVVLWSQTIQKTHYESKHECFSASWFRRTSVCLFTKLMCCFSFHNKLFNTQNLGFCGVFVNIYSCKNTFQTPLLNFSVVINKSFKKLRV